MQRVENSFVGRGTRRNWRAWAVLCGLFVSLGAASSSAQAATWTNGAANGNYNTPGNWDNNDVPDTAGETAVFPNTLSGTINFATSVAPTSVTVQGGTYTFSGGGGIGGAATLNVTGTAAVTGPPAVAAIPAVLTIQTTNSYTGTTTIGALGTIRVTADSNLGTPPAAPAVNILMTGGVLQADAIFTLNANRTIQLIGLSSVNVSASQILSYGGLITATATGNNGGALSKLGTGGFIYTGTGTPSNLFPRFGAFTIASGGNITTPQYTSIGQNAGDLGILNVNGNGRYTVGGDFNVSDLTGSNGILNVADTGVVNVRTLYLGKNGNATGVINQGPGTTIAAASGSGDWRIGGAGSATDVNAVGIYNMTGGTFTNGQNFQIGAYGKGAIFQSSGTFNVGSYTSPGRFAGSYGMVDVSGNGVFNQTNAGTRLLVGENGLGILTLRDNAQVNLSATGSGNNGMTIGNGGTTAGGIVNLRGGTLTTNSIFTNTTASTLGSFLNFNGGTLKAGAASSSPFIAGLTGAYVFSNGAIFDTNNRSITVTQSLLAPAGNGVSSIAVTNGGSGYVTAPIVQINRGTGDTTGNGATAVATVSNGAVTGITITNPGIGYTVAPTVVVYAAGGSGTGATFTATIAPNDNTGSLIKNGAGTLVLSGTNTYGGTSQVNQDILEATVPAAFPGALTPGRAIANGNNTVLAVAAGGAGQWTAADIDAFRANATFTAPSFLGIDTAGGNFTYGSNIGGSLGIAKIGGNTLTLTGNNTYTGSTRFIGGFLAASNSTNLGASNNGVVFDGGGFQINGTTLTDFGGRSVSFVDGKTVNIYVFEPEHTFTVSQELNQGTGGLTTGIGGLAAGTRAGNVRLTGNNSFTGRVTIARGQLIITNSSALGTGTKIIDINSQNALPQLRLDGSSGNITLPDTFTYRTSNDAAPRPGVIVNDAGENLVQGNIIMTAGGGSSPFISNAGKLTISANISTDTTNRTALLRGASNGEVSGAISNGSATNVVAVSKDEGAGIWTLSGANTYTGNTTVSAGTLLVNSSIATSALTTASGGTLGGTGTVGALTAANVANSKIAPGNVGTPGTSAATGTLITGNVTFNGASTYEVDLSGNSNSDQLNVTGTVSLGNSTLALRLGYAPANGQSFTLINNDAADAVTGTFSGLAQGATVQTSFGGQTYTFNIFYDGGDGNDVVLVNVNQAPTNFFNVSTNNPGSQNPQTVTTPEDTPLVLSRNSASAIQVSDAESNNLQVKLTATNGTLTLNGIAGLNFSAGDGTGDVTMTFSGTKTDINTALNGLTFTPTLNYNGSASINIITDDLDGSNPATLDQDNDTLPITITEVNDVPVLTNIEGTDLTYNEGAGDVSITSTLQVNDVDSATLTGGTVKISAGFVSGEDVLSFADTDKITSSLNATGDTLILTGAATTLEYQAALRNVKYRNSSLNPTAAKRSVSFQVSDGAPNSAANLSNIQTRDIDVKTSNGTPTLDAITPNPLNINEDAGQQTVNLSGIDDGDGDLQTLTITATSNNTAVIPNPTVNFTDNDSTATLTFTPVANASGTAIISVTVTDDFNPAASITRELTVNVAPQNDAPTISAIADVTINEDTNTGPRDFTVGDLETVPGNLQITKASSNVALVPTDNIVIGGAGASRTVTVTPVANGTGSAVITLTVSDENNATASEQFTVTVTPINDAPSDITLSNNNVSESAPVGTTVGTFSTTDVDDTTFTYALVTGAGSADNAKFDIQGNQLKLAQIVDYETDADKKLFIRVSTSDGVNPAFEKEFVINITDESEPPFIEAGSTQEATVVEGGSVTLTTAQLRAGDTDNLQDVKYTVTTLPAEGTLKKSGVALGLNGQFTQDDIDNGRIVYTHSSSDTTSDSFRFTLTDGPNVTSPYTFNFIITPVNDAPKANGQSVTTAEDTPKSITLTATDGDSQNLTYTVTQPANGTVSVGTGATRIYTPKANFFGEDSFTFKANDGLLESNVATVTITVTPDNDTPVANAQTVSTNEDTARDITLTGTDAENSALTYTIVTPPTKGVLSGTGDNVTYRPNPNVNGTDSFTFKVNDGTTDSAPATVSITIVAVNDAPVAIAQVGAQSVNVTEDTPKGITLGATDIDSSNFTFSIVTPPTKGTLSGTGATRTYTPNRDATGSDSFTFKANDGALDSAPATVSILIAAVEDAPVAVDDTVTTDEDTSVLIDVTANDRDEDVSSLKVTVAATSNTNGVVSVEGNQVRYGPAPDFTGDASFNYTISDGTFTSTATVKVQVIAVNDIPVANPDRYTTNARILKIIAAEGLLVNDIDKDGDALNARLVDRPSKGTVVIEPNGAFLYTPYPSVGGLDTFTYVASDRKADSRKITVQVLVGAARDVRPPDVRIAEPLNGVTLPRFTAIEGIASDGAGDRRTGAVTPSGIRAVEVLIVRLSDNFTYNGVNFAATPRPLPTRRIGTTWRLSVPLPAASVLTPGAYQVVAIAIDNAGNRGRAQSFVRIIPNSTTTASNAPVSRIALSSIAVASANNSVRLQFTGAMNTGNQAEQFALLVNGAPVEVESIAVANNVITLGLPASTCKSGDTVEVQWYALKDASGAVLKDEMKTVTAR